MVVWPSSNSIGHINKVSLCRAQLVRRWVTIRRHTVLVCNQPLRPTQSPTLSGTKLSTSQGAAVVLRIWDGNYRSGVALAIHHRLRYIHLWT